ncbi:MAG: DEAD/DEAH box helicase [Deltaproteobacteria bacterium]|nr:DEAD/DEAH box helicase [Deltaproteobacteria bacterium]
MTPTKSEHAFSSLGISPRILKILEELKFKIPTPIQHQSIPTGIEGKDIIGIAQTGTGKTLAFGIPMLHRLQSIVGRGLILLPTRELALQVEETLEKMGRSLAIGTAVLIGGESFNKQVLALQKKPQIIIATPGRLLDHLQQRTIKLDDIKILVLDEADRMLDMGFAPQINQILKTVPKQRQTLLFSATMPAAIVKIAATYMALPVRIEVAPSGTAAEQVEQEIIIVNKDLKLALLATILHKSEGTALVFSRTKHGAKKICRDLNFIGYSAAEIHSNRSLNQRKEALEGFKTGRYRILVATDIAARGIDVHNIGMVINFDLPDQSEDYVHRIGRTGRAGREGRAISFATPDQRADIREIEKLIRKTLKLIPLPPLEAIKVAPLVPRFRDPRQHQKRTSERGFFKSAKSARPPQSAADSRGHYRGRKN